MNRTMTTVIASVAVSISLALVILYAPSGDGNMLFDFGRVADATDVIPSDISKSNNAFAFDMYRQIAANPDNADKNIFFSPLGMHLSFSLLYEGARAETASQMEHVFGFEPDAVTRHNYMTSTLSYVNRDDQNATLSTANALWVKNQFEPSANYMGIATDPYLADIDTLGFSDDPVKSADRINAWTSNKTDGKIKAVVTESDMANPDLVLATNNAIYFNGVWEVPFPSVNGDRFWTHPHLDDPIIVDTMRTYGVFNYTASDDIYMLKLPYKGERFSMLVFLHNNNLNFSHFEKTISAENIEKWLSQMEPTELYVTLPKFSIQKEYNLKDHLSTLGMPAVFDRHAADLSGINPTLYVGFARQNTFIDVNEKGSEDVTVIFRHWTGGEVLFYVNTPFMFSIFDEESKTIMFLGRVLNPTL